MIRKIIESGHEIGLHFDEDSYEPELSETHLRDAVEKEVKTLGELTDSEIRVVSMHRPSQAFLSKEHDFGHIVNSYNSTFTKDFKYLSDSRRNWRESPELIVSKGECQKIHLLTHPIWYRETPSCIAGTLKEFIRKAQFDRYNHLSSNIRDFESIIKNYEDLL